MNNNVNDIEDKFLRTNNDNVNEFDKSSRVEVTAMELVRKLDNPDAYKFYCKVAWRLPENVVWNLYESALKGKEPQKLFTWLANREMYRRAS